MCWYVLVTNPCAPALIGHRQVAEAAACRRGTLGRRFPFWIPETTLTTPPELVEVRVESSSDSVKVAEMEKSKLSLGAAASSISAPRLTAGTLKTRREEQVPAVTVS